MTMRCKRAALLAALLAGAGTGCQHEPAAKTPIPVSAAVAHPQSSGNSSAGKTAGNRDPAARPSQAKEVPPQSRQKKPKTEPVQESAGNQHHHPAMMACPWAEPGVTIASENVPGGAAIVFTAPPERVAALRAFVGRMAAMPGWQAGHGMGPMRMQRHRRSGSMQRGQGGGMTQRGQGGGMMQRGQGGGMMQRGGATAKPQIPPSTARSTEIPNGVRLIVVANDPDDTDQVRSAIHERAERMRAGACPMVPMKPGAPQPPAHPAPPSR